MSQKTLTQEQKAAKASKERARYAAKKAAKTAKPALAKHEVSSHITFTTARKNKVSGTIHRIVLHKKSGKRYVQVLQDGKLYVKQLELI